MIRAIFVLSLLVPTFAFAADRPKIAVLELEAKGVDVATAQTLADVVAATLKKLDVFDVISRADTKQMLSFEESKQIVGCSSSDCVAEIGGALGVAKLVTGSIGKIGNGYVLTLTLIDTKQAKVIERETRGVKTAEELSSTADGAAKFLVRSLLETRQGELVLDLAEISAEVEIDGRLFGLTPLGRVRIASGPHTVRISKKGFVTVARDVIVEATQPTVVSFALVPSPDFIEDYDRLANGLRGGAYAAGGIGAAMVIVGVVLRAGYNDRQVDRLRLDIDNYEALATAAKTADERNRLNQRMGAAEATDQAALAMMISGSVLVVAGIVVLFVGPKPGRYDQYKSVSVGSAKLSFDVSGARLAF